MQNARCATPVTGVQSAARSGEIKLSGANGPLFVGEARAWGTEDVSNPKRFWICLQTMLKQWGTNSNRISSTMLSKTISSMVILTLMVNQKFCWNKSALNNRQSQRWIFRDPPQVGQWDQDAVLLTVQMISTVQIFAGVRGSGFGSEFSS